MTRVETNRFKQILETKSAELAQILRKREGIKVGNNADHVDEMRELLDRELALRTLDLESKVLRQVRAALDRIEESTYGTCLHCEEEIDVKRLNAVPWASHCIACQNLADKGNGIPLNVGDLATA